MKALGDITQLDLRINSLGGDVFDGVTIHNTIRHHPANVTAYVDGIAASAASYIAMAADKIIMPANSFLLVHGASGFSSAMPMTCARWPMISTGSTSR
ncbi:ATP-dependent protease ClpP protease subunit [Bradyrhizobium sp. USDA 3256]